MNISQITGAINSFFAAINAKITKVVPMPAILLLWPALPKPRNRLWIQLRIS